MTWSPVGNLRGPEGPDGPEGPAGPASTVPGPRGPGIVQAAPEDRAVVVHVVPGASPFRFTCPDGQVRQFALTGGAGVSTTLEIPGQAPATLGGGTGTTPLITPGETIVVSWLTTAPTAIRSRALFALVP